MADAFLSDAVSIVLRIPLQRQQQQQPIQCRTKLMEKIKEVLRVLECENRSPIAYIQLIYERIHSAQWESNPLRRASYPNQI